MDKLTNSLHYHQVEDFTQEQHASLSKRPCFGLNQGSPNQEVTVKPNLVNEIPLGLRLKNSPDIVETANLVDNVENKNTKDKLRALQFPASVLKIGHWEYVARYECDLAVKFYFGWQRIVLEILQNGVKRKIEFQWSDIVSLKAECPHDNRGTLTIVTARQPTFYREMDPQPRTRTIWQASADFTDGQASIHRIHYIVCPPDILAKHYEKLIQCETLRSLSQQAPENSMSSPYFEQKSSAIQNPEELKDNERNQLSIVEKGSSSSSVCLEPSPLEVTSLYPSLPTNDSMGEFKSEQMIVGNIPSDESPECHNMLENNFEDLFIDTEHTSGFDEKSLMKKIDSFSSLLQVPVLASDQVDEKNHWESVNNSHSLSYGVIEGATSLEKGNINMDLSAEILCEEKDDGMQRKESYEDLL